MNDREGLRPFWGAFGAAVGFGVVYNQAIAHAGRRGYVEGYMGFVVALGTAITLLLAVPLIGLKAAALVAGLFVGSGAPMIAGSVGRHVLARESFQAWQHGNTR